VIASLTNASYLLIVTEPSMSAVHDMERLADLAAHFNIRAGVCINRCDISEEISQRIEQVAVGRGLSIHGQIPYDPAFTEAQLQGRTYLQVASSRGIGRIEEIWRSVLEDSGYRNPADSQRFAV
jgi:MinD superfamily P-loop ATPase